MMPAIADTVLWYLIFQSSSKKRRRENLNTKINQCLHHSCKQITTLLKISLLVLFEIEYRLRSSSERGGGGESNHPVTLNQIILFGMSRIASASKAVR